MELFKGSGVALVTPFKNDGSVDYETLRNLIDFQILVIPEFFFILVLLCIISRSKTNKWITNPISTFINNKFIVSK